MCERLILIAVQTGKTDVGPSLAELSELAATAGAEVLGQLTQQLEHIHPGHYLGSGKLDELKEMIAATGATGVVCDDELSPAQYRNMEKILETKILDRTMLILDIFAGNAKSAEGIAQVELAQLNYRLSRLAGQGTSLSRLGGGIGTRGPGEKKLETDRRHIRNRIAVLSRELKEIEARRRLLRTKRQRALVPVVALTGYTNAGKSTVMNMLSGADVLAENRLFATLDTTTRLTYGANNTQFLLTDTVGFIKKLPHQLIKAFRATLSELKYADILVHIVDASNAAHRQRTDVVISTLTSLGIGDKPIITVYNKTDLWQDKSLPRHDEILPRHDEILPRHDEILPRAENSAATLRLCALTGAGGGELLEAIENEINKLKPEITALLPYNNGGLLNLIHKNGAVLSIEYKESGIQVCACVPPPLANKLEQFLIDDVDKAGPLTL